jgi:hypothetical protein
MLKSDYAVLAQRVVRDLETYAPPPPHPEQVGRQLSQGWFRAGLDRMRGSLVVPYSLTVATGESDAGQASTRDVVIVADDHDQALLAFDPHPEGDFVVIWRRPASFALSHIRGDAVGCFLAI